MVEVRIINYSRLVGLTQQGKHIVKRMAFKNKNNAQGIEKLTGGSNDNFGENTKSEHNIFSFNSFSNPENYQRNPNLYQFEIVSGISRSTKTNTGPVFSFWTQSKTFEWNFHQKNRSHDSQEEVNVWLKEK
jgi:hypothetical protein